MPGIFIPRLRVFVVATLALLVCGESLRASDVTVTFDSQSAGQPIAPDFVGLSFEMQRVLPDTNGFHLFSPKNRRLIAAFKTLGVKSLRVGGNTADRPQLPLPSRADVDSLFRFAKAAQVKVIYTLRLREEDAGATADMAKYIQRRYPEYLDCFAIGNEPNVFSTNYATYVDGWKRYAAVVTAPENAPDTKFCGPSVSPGHESWSRNFANDLGGSGLLKFISQHDYPGGDGRSVRSTTLGRDKILAPTMDSHYAKFANVFVPTIQSNGLPYRLEEANSFYDGGAFDVSDTYASALWALNYMWWWASHGASGINFHTGDTVAARNDNAPCKYAVFWTSPGGYNVHPIGYALKAFSVGARGRLLPAAISNPDNLNVTAFGAVDGSAFCATVINKEHGTNSHPAELTLVPPFNARAEVMMLSAPGGDVSTKTGVTFGAAEIRDDAVWRGMWTPISNSETNGSVRITLRPASAAVVRFTAR